MVISEERKDKLEPIYDGPFQVVRRTRSGAFILKDTGGQLDRRFPIHKMKLVKSYAPPIELSGVHEVKRVIRHRGEVNAYEYLVQWKGVKNYSWVVEADFNDYDVIRKYWSSSRMQK